MLLNLTIFLWFGTVCPWRSFLINDVIPIYRLIFLGILVLLFRRLPVVFALHWKVWQIEQKQQALFVGFFGPIGVSAVFYLYISLDFLKQITVNGIVQEDVQRLVDVMTVVVWFLTISSIVSAILSLQLTPILTLVHKVVHGLSVPIGKLGYHLPRTFSSQRVSTAVSEPEEPASPFRILERVRSQARIDNRMPLQQSEQHDVPFRPTFRIGGSIVRSERTDNDLPPRRNSSGRDDVRPVI